MAWPTDDLTTTHYDQGNDDPSQARSELIDLKTKVSSIIAARSQASGVADLDGSGKLPRARLYSATESAVGGAELATQSEVDAETDSSRIVTPDKLPGWLNTKPASQAEHDSPSGVTKISRLDRLFASPEFSNSKLASAAAGAPTMDPATGASLKLLATSTANNDAAVDFTGIDGTYPVYAFWVSELSPATDGTRLRIRLSGDGGSTFAGGATDYEFIRCFLDRTDASISASSGEQTAIEVTPDDFGTDSGEAMGGWVYLIAPSSSSNTKVSFELTYLASNSALAKVWGSGMRNATGVHDAIRFFMASGNVSSGTIRMYGLKI